VGTREVLVSDAVAERFEGATPTAEEPEETPAPRKRAPRKAATPAAEES